MTPTERSRAWKKANRWSYNKSQRELMAKRRSRPKTPTVMRPVIEKHGVGSIETHLNVIASDKCQANTETR